MYIRSPVYQTPAVVLLMVLDYHQTYSTHQNRLVKGRESDVVVVVQWQYVCVSVTPACPCVQWLQQTMY